MDRDAFLAEVRRRAALSSPGDTETTVRAVLETLGERLANAGELPAHIAAQLPQGLGDPLIAGSSRPFERFDVSGFVERVAEKEGPLGGGGNHAGIVLGLLAETLPEGTVAKLRHVLTADYGALLEGAGPVTTG